MKDFQVGDKLSIWLDKLGNGVHKNASARVDTVEVVRLDPPGSFVYSYAGGFRGNFQPSKLVERGGDPTNFYFDIRRAQTMKDFKVGDKLSIWLDKRGNNVHKNARVGVDTIEVVRLDSTHSFVYRAAGGFRTVFQPSTIENHGEDPTNFYFDIRRGQQMKDFEVGDKFSMAVDKDGNRCHRHSKVGTRRVHVISTCSNIFEYNVGGAVWGSYQPSYISAAGYNPEDYYFDIERFVTDACDEGEDCEPSSTPPAPAPVSKDGCKCAMDVLMNEGCKCGGE